MRPARKSNRSGFAVTRGVQALAPPRRPPARPRPTESVQPPPSTTRQLMKTPQEITEKLFQSRPKPPATPGTNAAPNASPSASTTPAPAQPTPQPAPTPLIPEGHLLYDVVAAVRIASGLDEPTTLMCLLSAVSAYIGPNAAFEVSHAFLVPNRLFWIFTSDDPQPLQRAIDICFANLRQRVRTVMAKRAEFGASWQREFKRLTDFMMAEDSKGRGFTEDQSSPFFSEDQAQSLRAQERQNQYQRAQERQMLLNSLLQEPCLAEPLKWDQWLKSSRTGHGSGIVSLDLDGKSLESLMLMPVHAKRPLAEALSAQLAGRLSFLGATADKFRLPLPASWHVLTRPQVLESLLLDTVLGQQGLSRQILPIPAREEGPPRPLSDENLEAIKRFHDWCNELRAIRHAGNESWILKSDPELRTLLSKPPEQPAPPDQPGSPEAAFEFAVNRRVHTAQIALLIHAVTSGNPLGEGKPVGLESWIPATKLVAEWVRRARAALPSEAPDGPSFLGPDGDLLTRIVEIMKDDRVYRARDIQRRFHRVPIAEINRLLQLLVDEEVVRGHKGQFRLINWSTYPPHGDPCPAIVQANMTQ